MTTKKAYQQRLPRQLCEQDTESLSTKSQLKSELLNHAKLVIVRRDFKGVTKNVTASPKPLRLISLLLSTVS